MPRNPSRRSPDLAQRVGHDPICQLAQTAAALSRNAQAWEVAGREVRAGEALRDKQTELSRFSRAHCPCIYRESVDACARHCQDCLRPKVENGRAIRSRAVRCRVGAGRTAGAGGATGFACVTFTSIDPIQSRALASRCVAAFNPRAIAATGGTN
jgi:hypothetical protein